jgi:hypothetical protein
VGRHVQAARMEPQPQHQSAPQREQDMWLQPDTRVVGAAQRGQRFDVRASTAAVAASGARAASKAAQGAAPGA